MKGYVGIQWITSMLSLIFMIANPSISQDTLENRKLETELISSNSEECNASPNESSYKYSFGESVACSKWKNGSFWKGKVIERKKGLYKVKITRVRVEGFLALHLNANPCTGNKRLSYEDGAEYNSTEIWVLEACLD